MPVLPSMIQQTGRKAGAIWCVLARATCHIEIWPKSCGSKMAMMRVAISTFSDRISPVFDVARHLLVVDIDGDVVSGRHEESIDVTNFIRRANYLKDLGIEVIICGGVSKSLEEKMRERGMRVVSQRCGFAEEVLAAYISGKLTNRAFLMPGCRPRQDAVEKIS